VSGTFFRATAIPQRAFFHDREEIPIMRGFLEKAGTEVCAVQHVVNHATHIHSPDSAHDGVLPHHC
jgi:hypothetical protein